MKSDPRSWCTLLAVALLATSSLPADGAEHPGAWEKELFFGLYDPEPELLDEVGTVGMRLNYIMSGHFSVLGELGFINRTEVRFTVDDPDSSEAQLEYDAIFLDASLSWQPLKLKRWVLGVYGGPGWSFISGRVRTVEDDRPTSVVQGLENDSFSAHGGVSLKWYFGQGFYLRGTGRVRWFEARDSDDLDREITLALGL